MNSVRTTSANQELGCLLVVEDDPLQQKLLESVLQKAGYTVLLAGTTAEAEAVLHEDDGVGVDAILLDVMLPEKSGLEFLAALTAANNQVPVIVVTADSAVSSAVFALKHGAFDYLSKPVNWEDLLLVVRNAVDKRHMQRELAARRAMAQGQTVYTEDAVFAGAAMRPVIAIVEQVKASSVPVMLLGPSGVGKEVVARLLHRRGPRSALPFVAVNCAALPKDLVEAELFGHERGAFTGATGRRVGKFEEAGAGTLFLDEVGELELPVQAKLLRVVQEREFTRVGGGVVKTAARLITATNRDLRQDVRDGRFREDLFYRLEVVTLLIPALRDRKDELPVLAQFLLDRFTRAEGMAPRVLAQDALDRLARHAWPGNVRELENLLKRTCLLSPEPVPHAEQLVWGTTDESGFAMPPYTPAPVESDAQPRAGEDTVRPMREEERDIMLNALAQTRGNVSDAARRLGIGRTTFYRRARKHGIPLD